MPCHPSTPLVDRPAELFARGGEGAAPAPTDVVGVREGEIVKSCGSAADGQAAVPLSSRSTLIPFTNVALSANESGWGPVRLTIGFDHYASTCSLIQDPISSRAIGAIVSSFLAYSDIRPVSLV
jgi:hypothetical protein